MFNVIQMMPGATRGRYLLYYALSRQKPFLCAYSSGNALPRTGADEQKLCQNVGASSRVATHCPALPPSLQVPCCDELPLCYRGCASTIIFIICTCTQWEAAWSIMRLATVDSHRRAKLIPPGFRNHSKTKEVRIPMLPLRSTSDFNTDFGRVALAGGMKS